jgi:hypothetical protein
MSVCVGGGRLVCFKCGDTHMSSSLLPSPPFHIATLPFPQTALHIGDPDVMAGQNGLTRLRPHRASPDNRLSRADSLAYSLAGSSHLSGQQITQGGLTRQQSRRISALIRTTSCPGRTHSLTHSPAAPPDHCASSPTD